MNVKKWLVYGVIPVMTTLLLSGMYFSRVLVLQRIICPKLPPLAVDSWREFGLLENLQNVCLLVMLGAAIFGAVRLRNVREKAACVLLALFVAFITAEEADYGTHLYRYFSADGEFAWFQPASQWDTALLESTDWEAPTVNVHNRGRLTKWFKVVSDTILFGLFIVFPLAGPYLPWNWLRRLTPDRFAIITVLAMLALSRFIHFLGVREERAQDVILAQGGTPDFEIGAIASNLSEFRELIVYYLFMIYLLTALRKHLQTAELENAHA